MKWLRYTALPSLYSYKRPLPAIDGRGTGPNRCREEYAGNTAYDGATLPGQPPVPQNFLKRTQDARPDRADTDGSNYVVNKTAKIGTYSRRELDWTFQSNSANAEITSRPLPAL